MTSWVETVFDANYIGTELRLQATVTRIESSSIIAELDPRSVAPLGPWSSLSVDEDPDLVPQRLTERRDRTEHAAGTSRLVARATNGPDQTNRPDEPADRTARQLTRAQSRTGPFTGFFAVPGQSTLLWGDHPDVPFEWSRFRAVNESVRLVGRCVHIVGISYWLPADIDTLRAKRMAKVLDTKLRKLLRAAVPDRYSILVVEERDRVMSSPSHVVRALRAVSEGRELPDAIYLVHTRIGDPPPTA